LSCKMATVLLADFEAMMRGSAPADDIALIWTMRRVGRVEALSADKSIV
jgi:hypothetical protein